MLYKLSDSLFESDKERSLDHSGDEGGGGSGGGTEVAIS